MSKLDVLAISPHPDDAELACGGTLALLAALGRRVGILHLTSGEAGTRGTPEQRHSEAEEAGRALGVERVMFLDCGDGGLRTGAEEEDAVIEVLRRVRPELVLAPPPADRHPDHGRAHRLVEAAVFYSGLAKRAPGTGDPHRPAAVFHYMLHDPFEPRFIVDVGEFWSRKSKALAAYESQLHQTSTEGDEDRHGPATKVASRGYRLAVEGRARHFGLMIGVELGEPFGSRLPLAVRDPFTLLPERMR